MLLPDQVRAGFEEEEIWEPELLGEGVVGAAEALSALATAMSKIQASITPVTACSNLEMYDAVREHQFSLLDRTRLLLDHLHDTVSCVTAFADFMQQCAKASQADSLTLPVAVHIQMMKNRADAKLAMCDASNLVKKWDQALPILLCALRSAPQTGPFSFL